MAAAALGLLCSSACGKASDPEGPSCSSCADETDPASLDCNAPLPEQFIPEWENTQVAAPARDGALLSMGAEVELMSRAGHSLLAINPQERPYKVFLPEHCVALGEEYVSILEICVDVEGSVSSVTVLMSSLPIIDSQFPYILSRWRYRPYLLEGTATGFCYELRYRVI